MFRPGNVVEKIKTMEDIPDIMNALHLYDGPPAFAPMDNQMVCFTSPNYYWFDQMKKSANHIEMYMPIWTEYELIDANDVLNLGLDVDTIEERFLLFDGCARFCLATDEDFYEKGVHELKSKIKDIKSFYRLKRCVSNKANMQSIAHSIFYYFPRISSYSNLPCFYHLEVASNKIERMIEKNIVDKSDEKRREFVRMIKGDSKSSTMLGWMFEGYVNSTLTKAVPETLKIIRPLTKHSSFVLSLTPNRYLPAEKENKDSLDGYWMEEDENKLFLVQSTIKWDHPVKQNGIIEHIELLGLADQIKANEIKVILIFVVCKNMGAAFKKQKIIMRDYEHKMNAHVSNIPHSIKTVQQLHHKIYIEKDASVAKTYKKRLDLYVKRMKEAPIWDSIINENDLEQHVLELADDYKAVDEKI